MISRWRPAAGWARVTAAWCGLTLLVAPLAAAADSWTVDAAASRVRIHLERAGLFGFLGHDHEIDAPLSEGRIEVVADDPARSSVLLRFESRRLAIVPGTEPAKDVPEVESRMRGPELLDCDRHPTIEFRSDQVTPTQAAGDGEIRLRVRGRLALKGRSVEVELPLVVRRHSTDLAAEGQGWLRLRALGIEPPSVAGVVKVADRFRVAFVVRAHPRLATASRRPLTQDGGPIVLEARERQ